MKHRDILISSVAATVLALAHPAEAMAPLAVFGLAAFVALVLLVFLAAPLGRILLQAMEDSDGRFVAFANFVAYAAERRPHLAPALEALDAAGNPQPTLRAIGPPTAGVFGDPLGVPFISGQIRRILPDVLRTLDC